MEVFVGTTMAQGREGGLSVAGVVAGVASVA